MIEIGVVLANVIPERILVSMLRDEADAYLQNPSDEKKQRLRALALMLLTKEATEKQSVEDVIRNIQETQRIKERMNSEKQ